MFTRLKSRDRDRDVISSRTRRDRDVEPSRPRRAETFQKTSRDRLKTETFKTETTSLPLSSSLLMTERQSTTSQTLCRNDTRFALHRLLQQLPINTDKSHIPRLSIKSQASGVSFPQAWHRFSWTSSLSAASDPPHRCDVTFLSILYDASSTNLLNHTSHNVIKSLPSLDCFHPIVLEYVIYQNSS